MKAMLNLAAAVSLALCMAGVVLYARTFGHFQYARWAGTHHLIQFYSWSGVMGLNGTVGNGPFTREGDGWRYDRRVNPGYSDAVSPVQPGPVRWGFGMHLTRTNGPPAGNWRLGGWPVVSVFAPYWFVLCATAALPAWWLWRRLGERRRRRRGQCLGCGYDLRATPGRCPECGITAPAAARSQAASRTTCGWMNCWLQSQDRRAPACHRLRTRTGTSFRIPLTASRSWVDR